MSVPQTGKKSTARDMTSGPILKHLILFAIPLLLGNVFQLLYNTVDTVVVGNFVGTQALAAVGSTTMIVNMMVFFFNGLSIGATVVIGQSFGAKDKESLHNSIETTMALTFVTSVIFSIAGVLMVKPMLIFMATPADVIPEATIYLRIYLAGISGLLIYNMGSGILRAVGDTTRPLYFLIFTSVMNIILDLFFVIVLHAGIAGVAWATILSQFLSAILVLVLLTKTNDIYKMTWDDLKIHWPILKRIFSVGLPAAVQSTITAFSNVFVQAYVNVFGSACMAGWSCYNKLDQFAMIPMSSIANAATTFVSQNIGADQEERANKGTVRSILLSLVSIGVISVGLFIFAEPATAIFTNDQEVIRYSAMFLHANVLFIILNSVNHVLAGALRGRGDSKGPMFIMLISFVGIRQVYLYVVTHFVANTELLVGFGYPVGWTACFIIEVAYFFIRWGRKKNA